MENFKLDTKERFSVITPILDLNTANTSEELKKITLELVKKAPKNVILNFESVKEIDYSTTELLADLAVRFQEENASFVLCHLSPSVKIKIEELELEDILNITPTESEAWDIVQMEEIERDLLKDDI